MDFLTADLSSQADIRRLSQGVKNSTDRLDVLVNNAGGIYLERQETIDGYEMTFAVNHLAYFLLTNLVLDLIKASAPARIVSVASAAHQGCTLRFEDLQGKARYSGWRAYQQSKLANILFTRELARRLEGTGVTANAVPSRIREDPDLPRRGASAAGSSAARPTCSRSRRRRGRRRPSTSPARLEIEGVTGKYFAKQKPVNSSAAARDDAAARRLWEVSGELTGMKSSHPG